MMRVRHLAVLGALLVAVACVPKLAPLGGTPVASDRLPRSTVPLGHHKIVFTWALEDRDMSAKGDGVARVAWPDSARLDFFLAGGFGSGAAVLLGDSLQAPGGDLVRRLVPPPPLLWAALGRVALPNLRDTVIRVQDSTLRADVGQPVAWRLTFRADTLVRAERVDGNRVLEWVERSGSRVRYRNEAARRSLTLTITRMDEVSDFDASTWHLDR
jgi:hypothetical protein